MVMVSFDWVTTQHTVVHSSKKTGFIWEKSGRSNSSSQVQLQGVGDHLDQPGVEWEDQERDGWWGGDRVGRHHLLDGDHPCRAGVWDRESAKMFYSCIFLSQCVLCIKINDFYDLENYFSNHKSVFQIPLSIKQSLYNISEHEQKLFILLIILSSGCKG